MLGNSYEAPIEKDDEEDHHDIINHPHLSRNQKLAAAGLAFFSFLIVIFWSIQLKNSITDPLDFEKKLKKGEFAGETNNRAAALSETEDLTAKDTDKDGLSDWDELNIYNTSPYLEDTDSDGHLDKEEIDNATDPNCPDGKDCVLNSASTDISSLSAGTSTVSAGADATELSQLLSQLSEMQNLVNTDETGTGTETQTQNIVTGQADAKSLRAALIAGGMDEDVVGQFTDEDLMAAYRETAGSVEN